MSLRLPTIGGFPWRPIAAVVAVVTLSAIVQHLRSTTENAWTEAVFNFLHFPAFAVITWGLYLVARRLPGRYGAHAATWALAAALILGTLSELLQIPTQRDASLRDLLSNFSGSIATLLIVTAVRTRRWLPTAAAVALLLGAAAPLATISLAYAERKSELPVLFDFDRPFASRLYRAGASRITAGPRRPDHAATATIEFLEGPKPGITFDALWPDWRGYEYFVIEAVLAETAPLGIEVHIFDAGHVETRDRRQGDRFERRFMLTPGRNVIRISLEEVRAAPRHRSIDLGDIRGVGIFAAGAAAGRRFDLVSLRLAD